MITILNRAELTLTTDTKRQAKIRESLVGAGIDYVVQAFDPNTRSRNRQVSFPGAAPSARLEYRIYVRRKDLDLARYILAGL